MIIRPIIITLPRWWLNLHRKLTHDLRSRLYIPLQIPTNLLRRHLRTQIVCRLGPTFISRLRELLRTRMACRLGPTFIKPLHKCLRTRIAHHFGPTFISPLRKAPMRVASHLGLMFISLLRRWFRTRIGACLRMLRVEPTSSLCTEHTRLSKLHPIFVVDI